MDVRIVDLDGSVARQPRLVSRARDVIDMTDWGPRVRLACGHTSFARFQIDLASRLLRSGHCPALTFIGSGDFHHVSLALLGRMRKPFNLLVIDNHPDWVRGVPFLHCGTWLNHAARLPCVKRIFHVGGDVDFDNPYRWLAPWALLRSGKIVVLPAIRRFTGRAWDGITHEPVREQPDQIAEANRVAELLAPYRRDLAQLPLYVSLDRDVLAAQHAVVNWDSGHLVPDELFAILEAFQSASPALAGMDIVGDWSPVRVRGLGRRLLHWMEHPPLKVDEVEAQHHNEALNLALVAQMNRGIRRTIPVPA